jgi:periplasmic divalent cation tolerance protein
MTEVPPMETPNPSDFRLVITTVGDDRLAVELAREAVELRLAACVHLLPAGRSVYRWQDQVEEAQENTLLIKTTAARYTALQDWLRTRHPYDTPEIIALPLVAGLPDYLDWIRQCTP